MPMLNPSISSIHGSYDRKLNKEDGRGCVLPIEEGTIDGEADACCGVQVVVGSTDTVFDKFIACGQRDESLPRVETEL